MALINKQKYDPAQVQKLYDLVRLYHEKQQPIDYEIIVDGLKVVRRTSDPEMFFLFENFVTADTKAVEILFYSGNSNVNERRIFSFVDGPEPSALAGIDAEEKMNEKMSEKLVQQKKELLKDIQHEQLIRENDDLKKEITDLEAENARLEKANEELTNSQSPLRPFLGEIGSSLVESFIRRNPKIVKSIPGGEALAGLIEPTPGEGNEEPETVVSFEPKEATPSAEDQMAITFVNQLKEQFTKDEFDKIVMILQRLAESKAIIDQILTQYK